MWGWNTRNFSESSRTLPLAQSTDHKQNTSTTCLRPRPHHRGFRVNIQYSHAALIMASVPIGVIISGRPVLTEARVVSESQFAFEIPSQPSFSHMVVFLLPG